MQGCMFEAQMQEADRSQTYMSTGDKKRVQRLNF